MADNEFAEKKIESRNRSARGIFFPLLLIAIGVLFLLQNLNIIDGDFWGVIFSLWPLLFIIGGIDSLSKREGVAGPTFMIGLGVVFLAHNFDLLVIDVWGTLLRMWPLLLIAWGIDLVVGRRSFVWSVAGLVVMAVLILAALWMLNTEQLGGFNLRSQTIEQEIGTATSGRVAVKPGIADLRIDSDPAPAGLIAGSVELGSKQSLEVRTQQKGDLLEYSVAQSSPEVWPFIPSYSQWDWDLALTGTTPLFLETQVGLGQAVIDLTGVQVQGLNVKVGVGNLIVTVPVSGGFVGSLETGIGNLTILVPQGAAIRVRNQEDGIMGVSAPEDFIREEDVFTSPSYAAASQRMELDVDLGIGRLEIEYLK